MYVYQLLKMDIYIYYICVFLFPIYTYRVVLSDITACIDDTTDIENKGWRTAYSLGNPNGQRQYHSGILASMDVSRDWDENLQVCVWLWQVAMHCGETWFYGQRIDKDPRCKLQQFPCRLPSKVSVQHTKKMLCQRCHYPEEAVERLHHIHSGIKFRTTWVAAHCS